MTRFILVLSMVMGCSSAMTQPPTLIDASRTVGVAPLAVFFDVSKALSWEQIESSEIRWSFGDGTSFSGYMAAHVYELADDAPARDYTVRVQVIRAGRVQAADEITISVKPSVGTTYCVSSAGEFDGCPAKALQRTGINAVWGKLSTGARLLLRRGETWKLTAPVRATADGPVTIGAFGPASLPRPHLDRTSAGIHIRRDWRLLDLEITGLRKRSGGEALVSSFQADNQLFLRVKANNVPNTFAYITDDFFFVDSEITGTAAYGLFMPSHEPGSNERVSRFAVLTSKIGGNDAEHCIRTHGSKVLIAGNRIHSKKGSILKISGNTGSRSNASEFVLIADNHLIRSNTSFPWAVGIGPENRSIEQYINKAIVDSNLFSNSDSEGHASTSVIAADDVTVRNNVFLNTQAAILMLGDTNRQDPHTSRIRIYNNTFSSAYPYFSLFTATEHNRDIYLHNNLVYATPAKELNLGTMLRYGGSLSEVDSDHNLFYIPGASAEFQVAGMSYQLEKWKIVSGNDTGSRRLSKNEVDTLFVDVDGLDAIRGTEDDDLHLTAKSVAVDAGGMVMLGYDHDRQLRSMEGRVDVGAFER